MFASYVINVVCKTTSVFIGPRSDQSLPMIVTEVVKKQIFYGQPDCYIMIICVLKQILVSDKVTY